MSAKQPRLIFSWLPLSSGEPYDKVKCFELFDMAASSGGVCVSRAMVSPSSSSVTVSIDLPNYF